MVIFAISIVLSERSRHGPEAPWDGQRRVNDFIKVEGCSPGVIDADFHVGKKQTNCRRKLLHSEAYFYHK